MEKVRTKDIDKSRASVRGRIGMQNTGRNQKYIPGFQRIGNIVYNYGKFLFHGRNYLKGFVTMGVISASLGVVPEPECGIFQGDIRFCPICFYAKAPGAVIRLLQVSFMLGPG